MTDVAPETDERIPEIVSTWGYVAAALLTSDPTDPADPSVNLDTLAAIAHAKWRALEDAVAEIDRLHSLLLKAEEEREALREALEYRRDFGTPYKGARYEKELLAHPRGR